MLLYVDIELLCHKFLEGGLDLGASLILLLTGGLRSQLALLGGAEPVEPALARVLETLAVQLLRHGDFVVSGVYLLQVDRDTRLLTPLAADMLRLFMPASSLTDRLVLLARSGTVLVGGKLVDSCRHALLRHEQDALAVEVLRRERDRCRLAASTSVILLFLKGAEVLEVLEQL